MDNHGLALANLNRIGIGQLKSAKSWNFYQPNLLTKMSLISANQDYDHMLNKISLKFEGWTTVCIINTFTQYLRPQILKVLINNYRLIFWIQDTAKET